MQGLTWSLLHALRETLFLFARRILLMWLSRLRLTVHVGILPLIFIAISFLSTSFELLGVFFSGVFLLSS